jgi:lysophospholipase L1-like esterase
MFESMSKEKPRAVGPQPEDLKRHRVMGKTFIVAALVVFDLALFSTWIRPATVRQALSPENFRHENGHSYITRLHHLPLWWRLLLSIDSDGPTSSEVSNLRLFEAGRELGPAHSLHDSIREAGRGRYSHWGPELYFSASDNSDPSMNGRLYEIRLPASAAGWLLVSGMALLLVVALGLKNALKKVVLPISFVFLGAAMFIFPFELLLRSDYSKLHWLGVYGTRPEARRQTLNSKGYRDDEHAPGKAHDRLRILILGDSMTFGEGLADDQIYPRLLQARLGPRVEIIAMAHDGWSTADELAAFKREGLSYVPDIVVIAAVTNDAQPLSTEPSGFQQDWAIFRRLPLNLDFFRFLDYNINRLGDICGWRYSYSEWERDLFDPNKRYFHPWQATVRELAGVLKDHGIAAHAFIMISPVKSSLPEQIRKYDVLADTFAAAGFATVNLRENFVREFGASEGTHLWALPNDPHPGPAINQFFAREMARTLEPRIQSMLSERGLLPR